MKKLTILYLFFLTNSCSAQPGKYLVKEFLNDSCLYSYDRIKLFDFKNSSIVQVIISKSDSIPQKLELGDTIYAKITKQSRRDTPQLLQTRPENMIFYCDSVKVLDLDEVFYKFIDINNFINELKRKKQK